jgi:opacity protein-like surface antigen
MKAVLAASTFLFAASAFAAAATSLTGQWSIHNSIAGNDSDQDCKFVQQDNAITGTCKSAEGKDLAVTGTVDGKKVTWKYDSDYNGTALTLTYTATLDDSDKISGSVEVEPFGVSGDFTATPVKEGKK